MEDDTPLTPDPNNRFGESVRRARKELGKAYSYRKVDELSQKLESDDSQRFERTSRSFLWEIENLGDQYIATRAIGPGKIRAIVEIIYKGNTERFLRETGYEAGLGLGYEAPEDEPEGSRSDVPFYLEMERPATQGWDRFKPPLVPGVDFLLEARLSRMAPLVNPGMVAYCALRDQVGTGEIAVLLTHREGLVFAGHLGDGQFCLASTHEVFRLGPEDRVYGAVQWIKPMIVQ